MSYNFWLSNTGGHNRAYIVEVPLEIYEPLFQSIGDLIIYLFVLFENQILRNNDFNEI